MTVSPGLRIPSFSASSTILTPILSLTEPPALKNSHLATGRREGGREKGRKKEREEGNQGEKGREEEKRGGGKREGEERRGEKKRWYMKSTTDVMSRT